MKFNEKLIQLRKNKSLTQEQLAEQLGVSRQAVSRWESGESTPDMLNLLGICQLFQVSSDYLIHDDYQSDEDIPLIRKKNEEIKTITISKKRLHLISAVCFCIAAACAVISIIFSTNDMELAHSIFFCSMMAACAVMQFVLYFRK